MALGVSGCRKRFGTSGHPLPEGTGYLIRGCTDLRRRQLKECVGDEIVPTGIHPNVFAPLHFPAYSHCR